MIKEEKSRNWGQGCIFNAGIQSTEVQYQSSIFQYLQRRAGDNETGSSPRVSKQEIGRREEDASASLLNESLSGFCQLQKLSSSGVLGTRVFY